MGFNTNSQSQSSMGSGVGVNTSVGGTDIWGQQIPGFAQLFSNAMGLQSQQSGQLPGTASGLVAGVMPQAQAGLGALSRIAGGSSPIEAYTSPNNDLARTQLGQMTDDISSNFARSILPQIRTGAGLAGGVGGSREALAQGVAAGDASRAIASAGTNLYGQQYQIGANAAAGATDARLAAGQALPGLASQVFNLGMAPMQAAWAPLQALAQILGNPAILSRQMSTGVDLNKSSGQSKGGGWGFSFV
jgi:hypothetical protein